METGEAKAADHRGLILYIKYKLFIHACFIYSVS